MKMPIIALAMLSFVEVLHSQQVFDMNQINQLTQAMIAKKLHVNETSIDIETREESQEFQQLMIKCKADWEGILNNFEAIEGGEVAQRLVVAAFQVLDAGDYMSAIEKLVTRFEAGTVGKQLVQEILSPYGRMQAFLADNHTNARVTAALNKIKARVGDDPNMIGQIDDLLSGETKLGLDEFREAHQETSEGEIPKILLSE